MKTLRKRATNVASLLTAMEVFVLALLSSGRISTVYDFKRRLLLSQGAVQSTISHLESLGYIAKSSPAGSLQRKNLVLTEEGRKNLRQKWSWGLGQAVSADAETVLRVAWAAAQLDENTARDFLGTAAANKEREASKRMSEVQNYLVTEEDPDSLYRMMRFRTQAEQLKAEARSLMSAAKMFHEWIERRNQYEQQQTPSADS